MTWENENDSTAHCVVCITIGRDMLSCSCSVLFLFWCRDEIIWDMRYEMIDDRLLSFPFLIYGPRYNNFIALLATISCHDWTSKTIPVTQSCIPIKFIPRGRFLFGATSSTQKVRRKWSTKIPIATDISSRRKHTQLHYEPPFLNFFQIVAQTTIPPFHSIVIISYYYNHPRPHCFDLWTRVSHSKHSSILSSSPYCTSIIALCTVQYRQDIALPFWQACKNIIKFYCPPLFIALFEAIQSYHLSFLNHDERKG